MAESNTNQDQEAIDQLVNYTVNWPLGGINSDHDRVIRLKIITK